MENNPTPQPKKPVAFHSGDISGTKAHEKREVFVHVEEKKTIKQTAAEFQKKFADAKAHAAETRAKIENPGADANGVIRSHGHKAFPTKLVLKIAIPIFILAGIGLAVYLNWGAIYHEFFEVSTERATDFLDSNPQRFIEMYDQLIAESDSDEEKVSLLFLRMGLLESHHGETFAQQILKDAYQADEIWPCYETAERIVTAEETYGSSATAEEWKAKLETRERGGLILGNG